MSKLITLCIVWTFMTQHFLAQQHSICEYSTGTKKMLYAVCDNKKLDNVPLDLDPKIEGLILTWNHIHELHDDTFQRYRSLQYLNLTRLAITKMDSHTLAPLNQLETLILSHNPALNISTIYFPTSLRKLYLDKTVFSFLPFSSLENLNSLSLKNCDLNKLPSFGGVLPRLQELAIDDNPLKNFEVEDLASMCNLKSLNLPSNITFQNECECIKLQNWIKDHNIIIAKNLLCKDQKDCNVEVSEAALDTYNRCKRESAKLYFFSWMFYVGAFLAIYFSIISLYWICNRKNVSFGEVCTCGLYCKKNPVIDINNII